MNFGAFGIAPGNAFDPRRRLATEKLLPFLGGQRGLRLGNAGVIASGTPNSQVKVTADILGLGDGQGNFVALTNWDLTLSTATSGLLGIDTGSVASNTWYEVWAIWSSKRNARSAILTAAGSPPVMPYQYDYALYLGSVRTDGSNNLYRTQQIGKLTGYVVTAGTNTAAYRQLGSGSTGNVTTPTWTSVAVAAFVPTRAVAIDVLLALTQLGSQQRAIAAPNNAFGGVTTTSNPPPLLAQSNNTASNSWQLGRLVLEGANVFWAADVSGALFCVTGWLDGSD
jgi:hypothetical protein